MNFSVKTLSSLVTPSRFPLSLRLSLPPAVGAAAAAAVPAAVAQPTSVAVAQHVPVPTPVAVAQPAPADAGDALPTDKEIEYATMDSLRLLRACLQAQQDDEASSARVNPSLNAKIRAIEDTLLTFGSFYRTR